MNIINIFKKGVEELHTGVDTWVVEWTRRYGEYSGETAKCFQAFTDKDEAERFAAEIRRAHKLIGNTYPSEIMVTVRKQQSGL